MIRVPPILVVTLMGAIAFLSVLKVRFSSSLYELLPQDLPEVRGMDQINRHFGRHGQLIVTINGETPLAVEEAGNALAHHLREREGQVAEVFREPSFEDLLKEGGELLAWTWLNARPEALAALLGRLGPEGAQRSIEEALAAVADSFSPEDALLTSYDPLGLARLNGEAARADPMRSASGLFAVLYVEGRGVEFSDYRAAKKWLDGIRVIVADWQAGWEAERNSEPPVRIGLTGTPAFMAEVGSKMERDMTGSVLATLVLISLLFFVMHRQLRPLSWLLAAMLLVLAVTLNLGAFLYGDLSVMSVGFAAILMGLAVDYGIVLYREAIVCGGSARQLRRAVGPGIFWAAATTALVFLSLNLSSLPGLAEMGNLVAIGVMIGAAVMLYLFAPVAVEFRKLAAPPHPVPERGPAWRGRGAMVTGVAIPLLAVVAVMVGERPSLEANFHPFRIRESASMVAWKELQMELRGHQETVPAIITGADPADLHRHLAVAGKRFAAARESGLLRRFLLPTDWIPNPAHQAANVESIRRVLGERGRLGRALDAAGFSSEGAALTEAVFDSWSRLLEQPPAGGVELPEGRLAAWSIDRVYRSGPDGVAALAAVAPADAGNREWVGAICDENTNVASLPSLGTALNDRIRADLTRVFLPMLGVLVVMLALVFRAWRDVLLGLFCLGFAGAALVILTVWSPLAWNSFNVCGLPLLFGTGLDYGIHMILALRRSGGRIGEARRGMGKALVFCGLSSAIGFGSLVTASAHGLSSLGLVCAVGILINMIVAVVLLPHWYRWVHRGGNRHMTIG